MEEVARLRADCREAQAATATATREFEALFAHSSTLQDGFYQALDEIEKDSAERLINPREAERLRARLGELEGQIAEAATARMAVEEDFARTLQAREQELATAREELRMLQAQMRELADLEAEEERLRTILARERIDDEKVAAEPADSMGPTIGLRGGREASRAASGSGLAGPAQLRVEPTMRSNTPARQIRGPGCISAPHSSGDISARDLDIALELMDLPVLLPQLMDLRGAQPLESATETRDDPIDFDVVTEPIADRSTPGQPGSDAGHSIDVDLLRAEASQLKAEILGLLSMGRKKDAEVLSRRMVELMRAISGELSPDHSTWMTVVGQLQAEQADWAGARSTFDRKNAIFRDEFGELDPRYLNCLSESAAALLACGDRVGAEILLEEAEALCLRALGPAHAFAIAIRRRLDGVRGRGLDCGTIRIST